MPASRWKLLHDPGPPDGQVHLIRSQPGEIKLLITTTTGCFATRESSEITRIHHWYYQAKGKEPVILPMTRSLLAWSCLAPWDATAAGHIRQIRCPDNDLEMLDVRDLPQLRHLQCQKNGLEALDCSGLKELRSLNCMDNDMARLEIAGCTSLAILRTQGNQLSVRLLTPLQGRAMQANPSQGRVGNSPRRRPLVRTSLFDL